MHVTLAIFSFNSYLKKITLLVFLQCWQINKCKYTVIFNSEGEMASEPWMQLYGRHSGNEVYHIQLAKSIFFSQYEGKTFSTASAEVHSK